MTLPTEPQSQSAPPPQAAYTPPPGTSVAYAASASRLVAYIIDLVIIGFVVGFFFVVGNNIASGHFLWFTFPETPIGIVIELIGLVVGLLWKPWFWSHGGRTPGYRILDMQIVREADGGPVSFGTALLRLVGYAVSAIVFYIGFIWIIFDPQRQGWHDKIAKTVVIKG
jgi:uncharacterized RDD family membrane protein YckC